MAIYLGHEGVARKCQTTDAHNNYSAGHVLDELVGMDGVARRVMAWPEQLSHLEICLRTLRVGTLSSDGDVSWTLTTDTVSDISGYGSLTVTSNSIQIYCSSAGYALGFEAPAYLVFKDGHRVSGIGLRNAFAQMLFTVGYSIGFRGNGNYYCYFCGDPVKDGHINNSASGSTVIGGYLATHDFTASSMAGTWGSYAYVTQIYQGCTIGGRDIPIRIVNILK